MRTDVFFLFTSSAVVCLLKLFSRDKIQHDRKNKNFDMFDVSMNEFINIFDVRYLDECCPGDYFFFFFPFKYLDQFEKIDRNMTRSSITNKTDLHSVVNIIAHLLTSTV